MSKCQKAPLPYSVMLGHLPCWIIMNFNLNERLLICNRTDWSTAWLSIYHTGKDEGDALGSVIHWKWNLSVTPSRSRLSLSPSMESSRSCPKAGVQAQFCLCPYYLPTFRTRTEAKQFLSRKINQNYPIIQGTFTSYVRNHFSLCQQVYIVILTT